MVAQGPNARQREPLHCLARVFNYDGYRVCIGCNCAELGLHPVAITRATNKSSKSSIATSPSPSLEFTLICRTNSWISVRSHRPFELQVAQSERDGGERKRRQNLFRQNFADQEWH